MAIYNRVVNDTNPYASPQTSSHATGEATPPEPTAWHAGDVVLVRRMNAVLPKACIKTNREGKVLRYSITTLTTRAALIVMALFLLPFLGLMLGCLVVVVLSPTGEVGNTTIWLRPRVALRFWAYDLTTVLMILAGNLASGFASINGDLKLFIVGMACTLAGLAVSMLPFQWLESLRLDLRPPDLVCIRGAHPDYLSRLPPLDHDLELPTTGTRGVAISG